MVALRVRTPEQDPDIQVSVHRAVGHVKGGAAATWKRKSSAKKVTVNQTLWRACSIACPIRSKAETPSTTGRTRFPDRSG
jgi:hypothetical protein